MAGLQVTVFYYKIPSYPPWINYEFKKPKPNLPHSYNSENLLCNAEPYKQHCYRIMFYKQRFLGIVKILKKLSNRTNLFWNLKQRQENY